MLTRAEGRRQRREIMKEIAREHRREQREKLAHLRQELRDARALRQTALRQAKDRCRTDRLAARARARELRARLLAELRQAVRAERTRAKEDCAAGLAEARAIADNVQRARAELAAERKYRRDLARIERANRQRFKETRRATSAERRGESDDEVRGNIPPELLPLWERVKRSIRGSSRMSRTEAFLEYAEEHPSEVLEVLEDRTDALVRELEAKEREARRALQRGVPKDVFAEVVPF
jgi:hypothetical protein